MKILVDADACPSREKIIGLANTYKVPIFLYCDFSHALESEDATIIYCDTSYQSVDMKIINDIQKGDILITQDYGLAMLALSKECLVFHVSGFRYEKGKIDKMMELKHQNAKLRRSKVHVKGPKKRTKEEERNLLTNLEKVLKQP